jgi:hypothetical protein
VYGLAGALTCQAGGATTAGGLPFGARGAACWRSGVSAGTPERRRTRRGVCNTPITRYLSIDARSDAARPLDIGRSGMDVPEVYRKIHELGVPLVTGLTEATKQVLPPQYHHWAPWISIAWGIVAFLASAYLAGEPLGPAVLDGMWAGVGAAGLVKAAQLLTTKLSNGPK